MEFPNMNWIVHPEKLKTPGYAASNQRLALSSLSRCPLQCVVPHNKSNWMIVFKMCLWPTRPILASLPSPQCVQHFSLQSLFSGSQLCSNQSRVHSTMHLPVVVDKKQDNAKTIISIFRNGREKIIMRNRRWNLHVVEWNFFRTLILSSLFNIEHNTIIVLVDLSHHSNPQTGLACWVLAF